MTVDSCSPDISSAFASLPAPSNSRSWSSRTNAETFHGRAHEKRELCAEKKVRFVEQDGTPGASTSFTTTISGTPSTLGTSSTTCSAIPQTMKELSHQDSGSTNHLLSDARCCKAATFGPTADATVGPPKTIRAAQVFDMTADEHLHAVEPTEHCVNLLSDSSSPSSFVGSDHRWLKIASGATDGLSPGPSCQGPGRAIQFDDIAYTRSTAREQRACQAWKRMIITILMLLRNTRQEMLMEYLTQRIPEPEETKPLENKRKKNKGLDPEAKVRVGIGKPLSRSVAEKEWNYAVEDCERDPDYLTHRAGRGHFWFTCLQCGARWERLETSQSSSSTSLVVEPVKGKHSKQAYPKEVPPPRYRQDLQGQNREIKVKDSDQLPIAPHTGLQMGMAPPCQSFSTARPSRSADEMSGLIALPGLRS